MKKLKNWMRLLAIAVLAIIALVLIMAEPNKPYSGFAWFGVLVATKVGALVCGFVAYSLIDKFTNEIKK